MEKKREKEGCLKTVILAIIMYVFLVLILLMTAVHVPNTYLPNIIGISLCWSCMFFLFLKGIIKQNELKKRKILIYMTIEILFMLCLNIYSAFVTQEKQKDILGIVAMSGFVFLLALSMFADYMRNIKKN